jgi:ferric-dicitrate binding protein FerR (iron transport regulator)
VQAVTNANPALPSGAAMDRALPSTRRRWLAPAAGTLVLAASLMLAWARAPRLPVATSPQLASAREGVFRDEVALRAHVEPLR